MNNLPEAVKAAEALMNTGLLLRDANAYEIAKDKLSTAFAPLVEERDRLKLDISLIGDDYKQLALDVSALRTERDQLQSRLDKVLKAGELSLDACNCYCIHGEPLCHHCAFREAIEEARGK